MRSITLREERQEGLEAGQLKAKREAVIELLEELGIVPESLIVQVESVEDFESLTALLKLAAKAGSIDSFEKDAAQFFWRSRDSKENGLAEIQKYLKII